MGLTGTPECLEAFNDFKREINKTSLTWEVNSPQKQVHYLNLTLAITAGKMDSTLYKKSLSLYLYLPPGSAHPPGILKGLIAGSILQIVPLTSNPDTRKKHLSQMFTRLLAQGYTATQLKPIFNTYLQKFTQTSVTHPLQYTDTDTPFD